MKPYFTHSLTVHHPDCNRPTNVITTSGVLSRYLGAMAKHDVLEQACEEFLHQFSEAQTSVRKIDVRFSTFDYASGEPTENKQPVTILATLATSFELTQIHLSVWDHVFRDASLQVGNSHYQSADFELDDHKIEFITLSERIVKGLWWRSDRGILHSWVTGVHQLLIHPLSVVVDPAFSPDTFVVITRCNKPSPEHSIYHLATDDSLRFM